MIEMVFLSTIINGLSIGPTLPSSLFFLVVGPKVVSALRVAIIRPDEDTVDGNASGPFFGLAPKYWRRNKNVP